MTRVGRWWGFGGVLAFALLGCSRKGDAAADAGAALDAASALPADIETTRIALSGQGVGDAVEWDFRIDAGARAGSWSRLPVPSHWEQFGFGSVDERGSAGGEQGTYRTSFELPARWPRQRVWLIFDGSMTDTTVTINGQSAGPTHQGGFYRFEYDVSELVTPGRNELEVVVNERSSNASVNAVERGPEHWSLGGIYRPVYLEVYPEQFIERMAADARSNGDIEVDVYVHNVNEPGRLVARMFDDSVRSIGPAFSADVAPGASVVKLSGHIDELDPWASESPTRYLLEVELRVAGEPKHVLRTRIGFRSVELRAGDGIYVNQRKLRLRGVVRRGVWPDTGYASSVERAALDVQLLKGMNASAARSAGRPAEEPFLDQADAEGLYVLDELAASSGASYDLDVGRQLVKELVTAGVNHPSVALWSSGSAFAPELDAEFARWDPSARPVIHPGAADATLDTREEPSFAELSGKLTSTLALPTRLLNGLYDGGGGAGLADHWRVITQSPFGAGAFLAQLADDVLLLPGGTEAPGAARDGLVDARRQPESSFYTLREIWSPVQIAMRSLPNGFSGTLELESRSEFLDLAFVLFRWRLANFHFGPGTGFTIADEGGIRIMSSVPPGASASLRLPLPPGWLDADALSLEALDLGGTVIGKWAWMLQSPATVRARIVGGASAAPAVSSDAGASADAGVSAEPGPERLDVVRGDARYSFDTSTGRLLAVSAAGSSFSFGNGPALAAGNATLDSFTAQAEGDDYVITATYSGELREVVWRVLANGWLSLRYRYAPNGSYDYYGVSFDYPEALVQRVQWLGRGPGRVWKNRLKGTWHDVWATARGADGAWASTTFGGYFADVYWARLATSEGRIDIVLDDPGLYLQLFEGGSGPDPGGARAAFPAGNISVLHGIAPIGDRPFTALELGPEGEPYVLDGSRELAATVYLRFDGSERAPAVD
jgi:hypothetical protein